MCGSFETKGEKATKKHISRPKGHIAPLEASYQIDRCGQVSIFAPPVARSQGRRIYATKDFFAKHVCFFEIVFKKNRSLKNANKRAKICIIATYSLQNRSFPNIFYRLKRQNERLNTLSLSRSGKRFYFARDRYANIAIAATSEATPAKIIIIELRVKRVSVLFDISPTRESARVTGL